MVPEHSRPLVDDAALGLVDALRFGDQGGEEGESGKMCFVFSGFSLPGLGFPVA